MEQNLSQYRIFYEVAKTRNISKAAKELFISQPAISKSISKLEDNLGVSLFTRNSRGVQLTQEGELLFEHSKTAFEALSLGEQELKRIQEFNIGHLRIGVSNTLCRYVLLPYLKDFIHQYPHIKISIESQSTAQTLSMLEQQKIDVGLIAQPSAVRELSFVPVMNIRDVFIATPQYLENLHLREGKNTSVLETCNMLLLDRNNVTRRYIDNYFQENHLNPSSILEVTSMDLLIEFAKIGLGVGCVIREFVKDDLAMGQLVEIPLEHPVRKRTIGFASNTNNSSRALHSFLDFINHKKPAAEKMPLI
ncbi:MAG: LysR family transcriptional regulator [bacterium]|nr:LysR family transcriptional regulator [bacterium]